MLKNESISKERIRDFAIILGHDFKQNDSINKIMWIVDECERELGINSILSLNIGRSSYGCHSGDN